MTPNLPAVRQQDPTPPQLERATQLRELIKAQIMPPRTDKTGKTLGPATDEETELMLAEADAMGLDILAGQAKPIRFEKGGPCTLFVTWEGLVKQAQDTGEWGGIEAVLYTDGTQLETTDEWGNIRLQYIWQDAWDSADPPVACKVGIWRKGAERPSWGIAHYSTWGTQPDPDGWSVKKDANGKPVRRRNRSTGEFYDVKVHNGVRVPKAGEWWQMPGAIHKLQIAALRIILKANFQPDKFRRATMAAASNLSREERLEFASRLLNMPVESFNELGPGEYAEVYDGLAGEGLTDTRYETEDTEPLASPNLHASDEAGPEPKFGESLPAWARPADSSAGEAPLQDEHTPGLSHRAPAEAHSDEGPPPDSEAAAETAEPAFASPEGTSRKAVAATQNMTGAAAAPARPKRGPRHGKPNIPEAQREAMATRRQTEVVHKPSRWLHTLPLKEKMDMIRAAAAWSTQPQIVVENVTARVGPLYGKSLEGWTDDMEWDAEQVECLRQEVDQEGHQ